MSTIAFIGAGNMASAIIGGLIENGFDRHKIWASAPHQAELDTLASTLGIHTTTDNSRALAAADVVILAVKPQVMESVLVPLQDSLQAKRPLLISVAAGINLHSLASWSGGDLAIVRCMPNTPALVQQGASGLLANDLVSASQKTLSSQILDAVGMSVWVQSEAELDAVTAVSGSGPAYFFLFMEAMVAAGSKLGLSPETATALTLKTALGAATMASQSDDSPAQLRKKVTSPNGTTEKAINRFIEQDLHNVVEQALQAANDRSVELCEELGAKSP
ncbi:MAG: pyrroline-5-carboxylate reductase [Bermanella sp.]